MTTEDERYKVSKLPVKLPLHLKDKVYAFVTPLITRTRKSRSWPSVLQHEFWNFWYFTSARFASSLDDSRHLMSLDRIAAFHAAKSATQGGNPFVGGMGECVDSGKVEMVRSLKLAMGTSGPRRGPDAVAGSIAGFMKHQNQSANVIKKTCN